jgi:hypothetical protein
MIERRLDWSDRARHGARSRMYTWDPSVGAKLTGRPLAGTDVADDCTNTHVLTFSDLTFANTFDSTGNVLTLGSGISNGEAGNFTSSFQTGVQWVGFSSGSGVVVLNGTTPGSANNYTTSFTVNVPDNSNPAQDCSPSISAIRRMIHFARGHEARTQHLEEVPGCRQTHMYCYIPQSGVNRVTSLEDGGRNLKAPPVAP